jgi:NAD(P)H-hydrate epimerase
VRAPSDGRGFELLATADEVREMDRSTIVDLGLPGRVLMELAGAGTVEAIAARLGDVPGQAVVLCGGGNNGGDGYVVARHLVDRGWEVVCLATRAGSELSGDARANHDLWVALGGAVRVTGPEAPASLRHAIDHADVIVDALFGTGLGRAIEGPAAELIAMANAASRALRVAVDVPSGVDATTGRAVGPAFEAAVTATFGLAKPGLYTAPGAGLAGEVVVVGIAFPRRVVDAVGASYRKATARAIASLLPARPAEGHKGTFGHVGVVGGFGGKSGAGQLAGRAALRVGAGLATWVTPGDAPQRAPELMHHDLRDGLPDRPDVFVIGPGLGDDEAATAGLASALDDGRPLVLDADALNLIATQRDLQRAAGHVITPHPREASRLLDTTVEGVEEDRLAAVAALVQATGAVVVLKGARTVVAAPGEAPVIFDLPTPALAAGGTGDVLAGAIGGLVAQGLAPFDAARCGVWLHAHAGRLAGLGQADRGVLATEVADALPRVIADLVNGWS